MSSDLEHRVARLEAVEAICRLQTRYAEVCDAGNDPDEMIKLFHDEAVWNSGERFGVHTGREEIYTYFTGISNVIKWAMHYMIAPVIDVSEDLQSATGRWYLWDPTTVHTEGGDEPVWLTAMYDVDYVIVDGQWKFKEVRLEVKTMAPYADGWVKTPFLGG